jgi:D-alanyl-D-alanine carboxypeptidase (penicillin-binding protein 5/6)
MSFLIKNNSAKNISLLMLMVMTLINVGFVHAAKPVPAPPEVAAKNYLLVDFSSGNVLAEKNAGKKLLTGRFFQWQCVG